VAEKFLVIVKKRNQLARLLGYEDFYDYKVRVGGRKGGEGPPGGGSRLCCI
jgi:hypothetical protein